MYFIIFEATEGKTSMNQEQQDALFGKEPQYSEHKAGETITFNAKDGTVKTGKILHVIPPGAAFEGGTPGGILYAVETRSKGFPDLVAPGDVII